MSQNQNQDRRQSIEPLLPAPATESNDDYDLPVRLSAPLANMGLSYSTAKYIAPLSFLYVVSLHRTAMFSNLSTCHYRRRGSISVIPVPSTDPQGRLCCPKLWYDGKTKHVSAPAAGNGARERAHLPCDMGRRNVTDDSGRISTTSTPPLSLPNPLPS
jgi:hypothetical protein